MTRKKQKNRRPTPQPVNEERPSHLPEPIAVARLKSSGPMENGRVWMATETMYAASLEAGDMRLISLGSQPAVREDPSKSVSSFAPTSLDVGMIRDNPPENLLVRWKVPKCEADVSMGSFVVGCEIWPNAKLQKGQIQLSSSLMAQLLSPEIGSIVYVHAVDQKPLLCQKLHLRFVQCVSKVGEDREQWLHEKLMQKEGSHNDILRTLMKQQLNGRLLLKQNLVPILLLGCSILMEVDQLQTDQGPSEMAQIDADVTAFEWRFTDTSVSTEEGTSNRDTYLKKVAESVERDMEGSRKEAGVMGALKAARSGIRALDSADLERMVIEDPLSKALHSLITLPLMQPSLFVSMGLTPPRGVILYGPPGSGKTSLASWAAKASDAHLFVINGPSLISEHYGESESALVGVMTAAKAVAPSLIFLDEVDALLPMRGSKHMASTPTGANDASVRCVTTLLSSFDALEGSPVVILAATNRLEMLDAALRRPGRFDREIEVTVPTPAFRETLLRHHLLNVKHSLSATQISDMAANAHGYLPADIAALSREAKLCALRRCIATNSALEIEMCDFERAKTQICPSGLREWQIEVPRVRWKDIGGVEQIKQQLRESIEWPLRHSASLKRLGTSTPQGILLFGPPGCSKTLLARAIATETGMNFITVAGSELLSMFVGESEKAVARLFSRARQVSPCIIFIDEVDGLMGHRESQGDDGTSQGQRILSQLLTEMDGILDRGQIVVIGATNKPQFIDPAMLRPGRLDRLILVPPPDKETRKAIFEIQFRSLSVELDVDADELAERTEHYTGADIASVCRQAGIRALEENMDATEINMAHFLAALEDSVPSLGQEDMIEMELYESFQRGNRNGIGWTTKATEGDEVPAGDHGVPSLLSDLGPEAADR